MPRICGVTARVPPHEVEQLNLRRRVAERLASDPELVARAATLFDDAGIERRYFMLPIDQLEQAGENRACDEASHDLLAAAFEPICRRAVSLGLSPTTVFCSGVRASEMQSLVVSHGDTWRLPAGLNLITVESSPAIGGVAAVGAAYHYLAAHPDRSAMVVALSAISPLLFPGDDIASGLPALALMSDGVGVTLLAGDWAGHREHTDLEVMAAQSTLPADSFGRDHRQPALEYARLALDPHAAAKAAESLSDEIVVFLQQHHLSRDRVSNLIVQPNSRLFLEAFERWMKLPASALSASRAVLQKRGNLGPAGATFVLMECCNTLPGRGDEYAVMAAAGGDGATEAVLLRS